MLVQWGALVWYLSDFSMCRTPLGRRGERQISAWEVCGGLERSLSNKLPGDGDVGGPGPVCIELLCKPRSPAAAINGRGVAALPGRCKFLASVLFLLRFSFIWGVWEES